ncbi:hypothetical protein DWY08_09245 [Clostridium sp. AF23-8]|jgi:hypothetical protein|nr:hypothetical protein DWY08_09245 [Clostridium sp. AF23-8]
MKEIDEMYVHKFRTPELMVVDEQELEEDRAYLRAMYPMRAKLILVMVEDACDRLEYEGSPMFAVYPDKVAMFSIAKKIYDKISYKDADETLLHMIEIMVCHEFYIRRCRYRKRRKYF